MQILIVLISVWALGMPASSLQSSRTAADPETVTKAFEHYEAIRAALAADSISGVSRHATELAAVADKLGAGARPIAEALGAAKDIKAARDQFGKLSTVLLPAFEKARLAEVHFFTCPMVKQSWAQKGKDIQNPYYGKSMLTCAVPKK